MQCNGVTKTGARCRIKTCKYAPKCHHHTALQTRPSGVAGTGAFARRDVKSGEKVADYTRGTRQMSKAQLDAMYPQNKPTHVAMIHGSYYDATNSKMSIAGTINRADQKHPQNVRLTGSGSIKATKNISAGSELFMNYGADYHI